MHEAIELYTDGAASGNPGPGGFAAILKYRGHRREISGGFNHTTNNRMELLAVIIGLESVTNKELPVHVYSDSKYVTEAINQNWLYNWQKTGFKNKANVDLWRRFLKVYNPVKHRFTWVKGHHTNVENNRCDELAVQAYSAGKNLPVDEGYRKLPGE